MHVHLFRSFFAAFLLIFLTACQPAQTPEPKVVTLIYEDAMAAGWQDWSWELAEVRKLQLR